jgi:hypothetical protein
MLLLKDQSHQSWTRRRVDTSDNGYLTPSRRLTTACTGAREAIFAWLLPVLRAPGDANR